MENVIFTFAIAVLLLFQSGQCYVPIVNLNSNNTECCLAVPRSVDKCFAGAEQHPISPKSAEVDCLQRLLWYTKHEQKLNNQSKLYFSLLSKNNYKHGEPQPKTGFRTRKEYRRYTDHERTSLHRAFQNLYKKGVLRKYAELHRHAVNTIHKSAAYLSWHRVFLAMFEDELRLEDITVSLPYWDSTLDEGMDNPVNSVLWSSTFLGNANGDVIAGPFADWKTARGNLWREYGSHQRGRLISGETINKILTRCKTDDIVFPIQSQGTGEAKNYVIEYHNNGVHNWVGGDMSDAHFAAYDPVFFMVHTFVDLIWERFRQHQATNCGIDPHTDYPKQSSRQGTMPNDPMVGFDGFKYIDGLKSFWTKKWYNYEETPNCPDCRSKFLFCNKTKGICVSHSRRTDYNAGLNMKPTLLNTLQLPVEPFEVNTDFIPKHIFGKFLPAPLRDRRTKESAKSDAKNAAVYIASRIKQKNSQIFSKNPPRNIYNPYLPAPPRDQSRHSQPLYDISNFSASNENVGIKQTVGLSKPKQNVQVPFRLDINLNPRSDPQNKPISNSRNKSSNIIIDPRNVDSLLRLYFSLLQNNIPALVNQGQTKPANISTSTGQETTKVFLNDTLKSVDLLSRLQKHNDHVNRILHTTPADSLRLSTQSPLIDLVDIIRQNSVPHSNSFPQRRKYLRFI